MWNLILVRLEIVLLSVQDWYMVCTKRTIDSEIIWTHPMVPLGDEALVDAHFGLFRDSTNLDATKVHRLRRTYHRLGNCFGWT